MGEYVDPAITQEERLSARAESVNKPRWVAFTIILSLIVALLAVPLVASAVVVPKRGEIAGVSEQVILRSEQDMTGAAGAFITPTGWLYYPATSTDVREFGLENGAITVTASVHTPVENSESLLRADLPVGATFTPTQRISESYLFVTDFLEYDLEAGNGVNQRITVCENLKHTACLLFEVEIDASMAGERQTLLPEIESLISSAEVLP